VPSNTPADMAADAPPLSLWRGDRLIGAIHLRLTPADEDLQGVVIPLSDTSLLESVWQYAVDIFPGKPVYQQPFPRDVVADRGRRTPDVGSGHSTSALEEVTTVDPGVSRDKQFFVFDQHRGFVPTKSLSIIEHVPMPDAPDPEIATFPPGAVVRGSVWLIWANFAAGAAADPHAREV
jgi:hypothetical protein